MTSEENKNGMAPIQEIIKQSVGRNQITGRTPRGKLPPQALDLETAVLGAILLEKSAIDRVLDIFDNSEVFYKDAHRAIYDSALNLLRSGSPIDLMTVKNQLAKDGNLEMVGGAYYLMQLTERVASAANIEHHARIIVQKWVAREGIRSADRLVVELYDETTNDVFALLDENRADLDRLATVTAKGVAEDLTTDPYSTIKEFEEIKRKRIEAEKTGNTYVPGLASGLPDLDFITDGFQGEQLWFVAARPSMGKTAFAINNLGANMALSLGVPGLIFQLEMSNKQQKNRLHCSIARVSMQKAKSGYLNSDEVQALMDATKTLDRGGIYSDDRSSQTILTMRAAIRKYKREKGIGWVIIDNKDIVIGDAKSFSRDRQVADLTRGLKETAKDLSLPIICLSQLSRDCEKRPGSNEPMKSDLRDSGACEQDADGVILLYRPAYYGKKYCETHYKEIIADLENAGFVPWWDTFKNLAFIKVDKNRDGATGRALAWFDGPTITFSHIEDERLRNALGLFTPNPNMKPMSEIQAEETDNFPF